MSYSIEKQVVVALHGSASNGAQWQRIADHFSGTEAFLTPDLPGYGAGDSAGHQDATRRLAPLCKMIRNIGRPVHLVGHSFGGTCAIRIAQEIPNLISSLSVYEPIVISSTVATEYGFQNPLEEVGNRMRRQSPFEAMQNFCAFWGLPQPKVVSDVLLAKMQQTILSDFDTGTEISRDLNNRHYRGPVRLMHGTKSPPVVSAMASTVQSAMPQAERIEFKGLDHFGPFAAPSRVIPRMVSIREVALA